MGSKKQKLYGVTFLLTALSPKSCLRNFPGPAGELVIQQGKNNHNGKQLMRMQNSFPLQECVTSFFCNVTAGRELKRVFCLTWQFPLLGNYHHVPC